MIPVGDFQIKFDNTTKGGEQVFIRRPNVTIKWPGGRKGPPKDSPECGFHGELCIEPEKGGIVSILKYFFSYNGDDHTIYLFKGKITLAPEASGPHKLRL